MKVKRILSAVLACSIIASVAICSGNAAEIDDSTQVKATASDNTSMTNLQNGSFEEPIFGDCTNPNRPDWKITPKDHATLLIKDVPYWNTTDAYGEMEFIGTAWSVCQPIDGEQAVELNAEDKATLYQYVNTSPGSMYEWGLYHRGRVGDDTMAVIIGSRQKYDPKKSGAGENDQFMMMVDYLKNNGDSAEQVQSMQAGSTPLKYTIYSTKFADGAGAFESSGSSSPFSLTQSKVYSEKWEIWIMKSGNSQWESYGKADTEKTDVYERYIVPEGTNESVFAFVSYDSAGGKTVGNYLDGVTFDLYHPTETVVNTGGQGAITYTSLGAEKTETIEENKEFDVFVDDGTAVTIKAIPLNSKDSDGNDRTDATGSKVQNNFEGAYVTINGVQTYYSASEFTESVEDGKTVYTLKLNNVSGKIVAKLFFSEVYTVTFLSNDGAEYNVNSKGTRNDVSALDAYPNVARYKENKEGTSSYVSDACDWSTDDEGIRFYGWELLNSSNSNANSVLRSEDGGNVIFKPETTITYTNDGSQDTSLINYSITDGESTVNDINAKHGAVFLARWQFLQKIYSQTKNSFDSDAAFVNSNVGGTVDVTASKKSDIVDKKTTDEYVSFYSFMNKDVTLTAKPSAGYAFVGWYTIDDDGTATVVSLEKTHKLSIDESSNVLYARFEPYKVLFHNNINSKAETDDIFATYKAPSVDSTSTDIKNMTEDGKINYFYDIPTNAGTNNQQKIFKGWYLDADNSNDSHPINWSTDQYLQATDIYAHWIDIGTVSKAEDDDKIGVNSYYGFDLFGAQIRNADDDTNYPVKPSAYDKSGLRFVTSFSEKLLSDIDNLDGTNTRPEYGYVLAKKSTAEKACENAGVSAESYELEYNGTNVNGKDTTAKSSYGYVTNVNCTSSKSYSGIVPLDHFNSNDYRIFSLVITYKKGGSAAQSQDVIARPYIRYTDANGLFRTYYSDYTGNSKLYGGCSTSFDSVKKIIAENYEQIQK